MAEPAVLLGSVLAAAVLAAAMVLLGWMGRRRRPWLPRACGAVGVALGWLAGCWRLDLLPRWPPLEDRDRLLLLLLPAVVLVEAGGAFAGRRVWPARLLIAAGAARVLLHNTVYLADLAGPGSREWSDGQVWGVLAGLAVALALAWAALDRLVCRPAGRSVAPALAAACAGSAVTLALSGYLQAGLLGLALAAALAGGAAALVLPGERDIRGLVGVGIVGLFGLLVQGRCFGELTTRNAGLLFVAPLLCWASQAPFVGRWRWRAVGGLVLALVPVLVAVALAQQKFAEQSRLAEEPADWSEGP